MVEKVYITYNQVHKLCQESAERILNDFKPNLMVAIGGGGYVPARILRSFLKKPGEPNIPIQAVGLSLYEQVGTDPVEIPGTKVTRTQWLDPKTMATSGITSSLLGKNILIVDEVDDTRTTLEYTIKELQNDVEAAINEAEKQGRNLTEEEKRVRFSIFVLHNKDKAKKGHLPEALQYYAANTTKDVWICYPWEATDIDEHDRLAASKAG